MNDQPENLWKNLNPIPDQILLCLGTLNYCQLLALFELVSDMICDMSTQPHETLDIMGLSDRQIQFGGDSHSLLSSHESDTEERL